nr:hypothetical protein [Mycolicibacterium sp. CBMA 213]
MAEAPVAIGYDHKDGGIQLYPLTPCCAATGKGSDSGIVCRRCYRDVGHEYGGFWYADERTVMFGGFNLASTWDLYTTALRNAGVDPAHAEVLTAEAKRQAALVQP